MEKLINNLELAALKVKLEDCDYFIYQFKRIRNEAIKSNREGMVDGNGISRRDVAENELSEEETVKCLRKKNCTEADKGNAVVVLR